MSSLAGSSAAPSAATELILRPPGRWGGLRFGEVWAYRELIYFFTKRELQIRYKQTLFGVGWAVLQPLALTFVLALVLGRLARIGSEGIPYPIFALAALVPWIFFSQSIAKSADSLVRDRELLSKVYFPRLVIPIGAVFSFLLDLAIALFILLGFITLYGVEIQGTVPLVVGPLLLAVVSALGIGVLFAGLNVRYRDVGIAMPLIVQIWLFATPVIYPVSLVPGAWQYVYSLNPMASAVEGVRWAILGTPGPEPGAIAISIAGALLAVGAAVLYLKRTEHFFADIV